MSNDVTERGAGGAVNRIDVRQSMSRFLAPFQAADPWREALATIERHRSGIDCRPDGRLYALDEVEYIPGQLAQKRARAIGAAVAIRAAVRSLEAVFRAIDELEDAMAPAPEEMVRGILGVMLSILRSKPGDGAALYMDALVWELAEPLSGSPVCAPAIAAAARETWTTATFAPSVHEFMALARKHQDRIEMVRQQLLWIPEAYIRASNVLSKLAPEKLPDDPRGQKEEDFEVTF